MYTYRHKNIYELVFEWIQRFMSLEAFKSQNPDKHSFKGDRC